MSRTLTSAPTGEPTLSAPPVSQSGGGPTAAMQRIPRVLLVAVPLVLILAGAAWATVGWRRAVRDVANTLTFTVAPRTFRVVLKEKGELKAAKATEIVCKVEGRSTIISLIPEGTAVKEGDLLVELASDQIEDRIQKEELQEANQIMTYESAATELEIQRDRNESDMRKAKLDIELKHLALEKYEKGDWVESIKDAQIAIDQGRINLKRRAEDFEASRKLWDRGFITKTEFDEEEFSHQRAKWDLEKALRAKEVLETYTHIADLRQRQSDLEEAKKEFDRVVKNAEAEELKKLRSVDTKRKELELIQAQLAKLRRQKENCRITAPNPGFVVYYSGGGGRHFMSSESQIREGATVHERQVMLTLPDTEKMLVIVRVHEAKTDKLRLGQRASVRVEAIPGHEFSGSVTKIAVVADTQNRWLNPDLKEYETEITLDPTDKPLKPGVTAYAEILVESVEEKLSVPVQTVYSKAGKRYVFQSDRGRVTPQPVQLGAIGTEWAEVVEGLSGGESILLAFSDDHKRLIPDAVVPGGRRGPENGRMGSGERGQRRPGAGVHPRASGRRPGNPNHAKERTDRRHAPNEAGASDHGQRARRTAQNAGERSGRAHAPSNVPASSSAPKRNHP